MNNVEKQLQPFDTNQVISSSHENKNVEAEFGFGKDKTIR